MTTDSSADVAPRFALYSFQYKLTYLPRHQARSKATSIEKTQTPSALLTFCIVELDESSTNGDQELSLRSIGSEFLDEKGAEITDQRHLSYLGAKSTARGQEHDLRWLTPQSSNCRQREMIQTPHRTHDNQLEARSSTPGTLPVTACPIHDVRTPVFDTCAVTFTRLEAAPARQDNRTLVDRYLAEGPAARYAIFSLKESDTEEWAQYRDCTCELNL